MNEKLSARFRTRPIRVAFLVQDSALAQSVLDAVFADCYGRWGGRFSLIVPCADDSIAAAYWPWLEAYDPDIVYSYVPLSQAGVLEVHNRCSPSEYLFHDVPDGADIDRATLRPRFDFDALSSLSVVFQLARHKTPLANEARVNILDTWHTESPTRYFLDNFGTYHGTRGGIFPPDALPTAERLIVVSPQSCEKRSPGVPRELKTVPSESVAVSQFVQQRATSVSVLSALFAPKLETQLGRWSESFNLVLGGSFTDRLMFWNARLHIPAWLDSNLVCLRVDQTHFDDAEAVGQLAALINAHNRVNRGSGGSPALTIRSTSASQEQLAAALSTLRSTRVWSASTCERIEHLGLLAPSNADLRGTRDWHYTLSEGAGGPEWRDFEWTAPVAIPPARRPSHLEDVPRQHAFTSGHWATDFVFDHDETTIGGQPNRWALPRRWRMAGAFKATFDSQSLHSLRPAQRRSRSGRLSLFPSTSEPVSRIEVPNFEAALRHALQFDGRYPHDKGKQQEARPPNAVEWTNDSNVARYLRGVLGLTGGLEAAGNYLLHPFMTKIVASLGGSPHFEGIELNSTVAALQKRVPKRPAFDLSDSNERDALASLIARAAQSVRKPDAFISYKQLAQEWRGYRERFWAGRPEARLGDDEALDWDEREQASLDRCLVAMRKQRLLFQGHHWICRTCHHRNWVDMGAMSEDLSCEVCKQTIPAPVNGHWLFRLNEFLVESLRSHGVLALLWALTALRERAQTSFLYSAPKCFGFDADKETADAEADLMAVVDGETVVAEVKSSWRALRSKDIEQLVSLAVRLRADTALLAIHEIGAKYVPKIEAARSALAQHGISFELLTPTTFAVEDSPYLRV